jgi:hypothetical protein
MTGPQNVMTGPQNVMTGPQNVMTGPQNVMTGLLISCFIWFGPYSLHIINNKILIFLLFKRLFQQLYN